MGKHVGQHFQQLADLAPGAFYSMPTAPTIIPLQNSLATNPWTAVSKNVSVVAEEQGFDFDDDMMPTKAVSTSDKHPSTPCDALLPAGESGACASAAENTYFSVVKTNPGR